MDIRYLNQLKDNPVRYPNDTEHRFPIKGIPETEIAQLEQLYNNSNPFPVVLKELLFLAGNFCYVLDYGIYDTQQDLQDGIREFMIINNRSISRPFYVFDVYGGYNFLFIYLDEGEENPSMYEAMPWNGKSEWIEKRDHTIQSVVNNGIQNIKEGLNPF